jgi:CRISPR-associated protein Cas8a1/Csx13
MAKELIYRLANPGYTIYHRAALGGLAATVSAWKRKGGHPPADIDYEVGRQHVRLAWGDGLTDQEALGRILAASFRLTPDKLIDLVGHGIAEGESDLRLAIHNGLCATFLQHNKMRPSEKGSRHVGIRDADGEETLFTYKAVLSYAHQKAQGTDLLEPAKKGHPKGSFPALATIPQSVIPGAMSGVQTLETPPEDAILLLFLIAGSSVFLLRSRTYQERMQTCVVVPDVNDLVAFSRALHSIASVDVGRQSTAYRLPTSTYAGRVAGGPEESALRFLVDLSADDLTRPGIASLQAIAMGKVAWDKNQVNRSLSVRIGTDYPEIRVFRAAYTYLGRTMIFKSAKGEGYAVPSSHVPELVAANLAAGRHWAQHFRTLLETKKDFNHMLFAQKGLYQMKQVIKDEDDQTIIEMFQEAWRRAMAELGARAVRDGLDFYRLVEVERERIRNAILRTRTADALAGWFLRFCADATKGASLSTAQRNPTRLREILFERHNFDRLQNLFLFALVSYAKDETTTPSNGDA